KVGSNLLTPIPCNETVTNTAKVTASNGTSTLTASDTAQVQIVVGGNNSQSNVVAGTVTTATKNVTVPLTNKGSTKATLSGITVTWPSSNGKLQKILLAGKVVFDTATAWTAGGLTTTTLKGTTGDRSLDPAKSKSLVFQFEKNVAASS